MHNCKFCVSFYLNQRKSAKKKPWCSQKTNIQIIMYYVTSCLCCQSSVPRERFCVVFYTVCLSVGIGRINYICRKCLGDTSSKTCNKSQEIGNWESYYDMAYPRGFSHIKQILFVITKLVNHICDHV